jgi:hypothetical protein
MSRRERGRARAHGASSAARPARGAARPAWWWAAALAVALALVALAVKQPWRAAARTPVAPAAAASAVDRLDARAAYREGARLYTEKHYLEAAPYFRRIGALLPSPPREYHLQIADVLGRAALESRRDAPLPATRSSVERIAMLREALAHLDAAERLSRAPREVAEVRAWRANLMRVWGFPWEALYGLRSAVDADSSWSVVEGSAGLFTYRLHHPDRPIPGIDTDVMLRDAP